MSKLNLKHVTLELFVDRIKLKTEINQPQSKRPLSCKYCYNINKRNTTILVMRKLEISTMHKNLDVI